MRTFLGLGLHGLARAAGSALQPAVQHAGMLSPNTQRNVQVTLPWHQDQQVALMLRLEAARRKHLVGLGKTCNASEAVRGFCLTQ